MQSKYKERIYPINLDVQVSEPIFANFVTVDKYSLTLSPRDYIFILFILAILVIR